jgi:phosphoglycolate phosphatase
VLSAAPVTLVRDGLGHFDLDGYFEHVNGLDHHYADSKIEVARRFVSSLTAPPETILLIGDTTHDFDVAREVGIQCILYSGGHHHPDRLQKCGVPVITSFAELF